MFRKTFILWCCFIGLVGCATNEEPTAQIVYNPNTDVKLVQRTDVRPKPTSRNIDRDVPREWYPPSWREKRWEVIVIHHSATDVGNSAVFDRKHREENHWEGVGYDFVIGNGTNSGDGEVEVTFRWRGQIAGAHCKTPNNWANEEGIGICLVGNFNYTSPTTRQMQSLVKLVRFLRNRYKIPTSRIYGHGTTPGARVTDCPGRRFPMAWLKSRL